MLIFKRASRIFQAKQFVVSSRSAYKTVPVEMGDLHLACALLLLLLLLNPPSSSGVPLSGAANYSSNTLRLSPGLHLAMYSPNSFDEYGSPISSDLIFTVATPTLDAGGLFFPILSSPSFINVSANSSSSSPQFGFSLGLYLMPPLGGTSTSPCDENGCNIFMAVCAGSLGTNPTSNTAFLDGALSNVSKHLFPYETVDGFAAPVWIANLNSPIRYVDQASLMVVSVDSKLGGGSSSSSSALELQLRDGDKAVWRSVQGNIDMMEMQDSGHLLLYNTSHGLVWQSSYTDSLVEGQRLTAGKDWLISNDSSYVARMEEEGLVLYMNKTHFNREPQPPPYWFFPLIFIDKDGPHQSRCSNSPAYALEAPGFGTRSIFLYPGSCSSYPSSVLFDVGRLSNWTFWRLESDGGLYSYAISSPSDGSPASVSRTSAPFFYGPFNKTNSVYYGTTPLFLKWGKCNVPMACGPFGVCTPGAETVCTCPEQKGWVAINSSDMFQGCKRSIDLPNCTWGKGHSTGSTEFVQLDSTASILLFIRSEWPTVLYNFTSGAVLQLNACKQSCSSDCSCNGFFYQSNTSSCFFITDGITLLAVRDQNYSSFLDPTKPSEFIAKNYVTFLKVASGNKLPTSELPKSQKEKIISTAALIALSAIIPSAVVCLVLGIAGYLLIRSRRNKYRHTMSMLSPEESKELQDILPLLPARFSYKDLFEATEGFTTLLGAGGCGSVYAGVLSDGRNVAVKVLQVVLQGTGQSKQFLAEIAAIGHTSHHNVVRLVGFCWEVSQRLLVYEYVERGSLDRWIFARESAAGPLDDSSTSTAAEAPFLDWKTRYNVALGVARGLNYLHEECEQPILHFDIKPQNILLDTDFVAKLADFGMSRLIERDMSTVVTGMRGTPGYIAPEWSSQGTVSKKSDVYSMGMVLLEIVGGRKNLDFSLLNSSSDPDQEQHAWHFPTWAAKKCEQGLMMELVDRRLHGCGFDAAQARRLVHIAFWCIQEDPKLRPNAPTVVQWLEGGSAVEQPSFSVAFNARKHPNKLVPMSFLH